MQINRDNLKWAGRTMLIMLSVGLADGLVGTFARKPFPWVSIIPGLIPLLICVFVIMPMIKAEKTATPTG